MLVSAGTEPGTEPSTEASAAPRELARSMAPGAASPARTKHGRPEPRQAERAARSQDGAGRACFVRTGSKMAAGRSKMPSPPAARSQRRRGGACPQQRWRSEVPLAPRLPAFAPRRARLRDGGGRAGVRVRALRQARCQRVPHPAAHLQPRIQVLGPQRAGRKKRRKRRRGGGGLAGAVRTAAGTVLAGVTPAPRCRGTRCCFTTVG